MSLGFSPVVFGGIKTTGSFRITVKLMLGWLRYIEGNAGKCQLSSVM